MLNVLCELSAYPLRTVCVQPLIPNRSCVLKLRTRLGIRETCLYALGILCLVVCGIYCCFGAITLSVNMAERPVFEKEMFALINVCSH